MPLYLPSTDEGQMHIIETVSDLEGGMAELIGLDRRFEEIAAQTGIPPLRRAKAGYAGLLKIIAGQQVSKASAAAIWARMENVLDPLAPEHLQGLNEAAFREAGLSGPKIRAVQALTEEVLSGRLDLTSLEHLGDDEVTREITAVKGLGPWSAEVYLLACLGRSDAWPSGDLALQIAAQDALILSARPSTKEMISLAESWRPWRAVAARILWAHYALQLGKQDQGM